MLCCLSLSLMNKAGISLGDSVSCSINTTGHQYNKYNSNFIVKTLSNSWHNKKYKNNLSKLFFNDIRILKISSVMQ